MQKRLSTFLLFDLKHFSNLPVMFNGNFDIVVNPIKLLVSADTTAQEMYRELLKKFVPFVG